MTLAERLRAALARPHAGELLTGDLHPAEIEAAMPPARAAVLVAVTDRPEPGILLTLRTDTLARHAGQVAFPGGRIDPGDADATAAALREASEEIGLPPHEVQVAGAGDDYRTGTGFVVTPIIGVIPPDLSLIPSPHEVEAIFEVPMAHLLTETNFAHSSIEWRGRQRYFREMHWQDYRIWGATAAILVNLARRLDGAW